MTEKEKVSMWDLLEGHKNPGPLLWSWFGAVKMERKPLTYEENHRLLKFHTHSLVKPSSFYYEPLPLPPEDAEEPMLDKNRDEKDDTPSSVESPSGMGSARKKAAKKPRKPKAAGTPTANVPMQNQIPNQGIMMQTQHPQQIMNPQMGQQFNSNQQQPMNNMNMMQNNMGMMQQNNMMMGQMNMGMGQNINQNQIQVNQQMNMNQMPQNNTNMGQINPMQYQQQQQQQQINQMNINQQNMGQMNMNMNQMGQQNQQWNYNNMQQPQQTQAAQGNQQFYNQGMNTGAPQSTLLK